MSDFMTLTCPTCGGKLQITEDIDRFACAYCGSEHIVRRSGGVVSLKPVMGLLEKTTSELAIMRLEGEQSDLRAGIKRAVLDMGLLSAVRRPSFRPLLIELFRLLLLAAGMFVLYRFYIQFTSGNHIQLGTIGYIVGLLAILNTVIELAGVVPLMRIVKQIRTLNEGNRQYKEIQVRLAQCILDHQAKKEELEKLEKELERHRSVVGQGSE